MLFRRKLLLILSLLQLDLIDNFFHLPPSLKIQLSIDNTEFGSENILHLLRSESLWIELPESIVLKKLCVVVVGLE